MKEGDTKVDCYDGVLDGDDGELDGDVEGLVGANGARRSFRVTSEACVLWRKAAHLPPPRRICLAC